MIIEHAFVTTKPQDEALESARQFLARKGFTRSQQADYVPGSNLFEVQRGERKPQQAKTIADLPQRVRVEYDRGRISVAALIEASATWGGGGGNFTITSGPVRGRPGKMVVHEQMLLAIISGLERLLAHDGSGLATYDAWDAAEQVAVEMAAKRKRRQRNALLIALAIVILLVIAAVIASR